MGREGKKEEERRKEENLYILFPLSNITYYNH